MAGETLAEAYLQLIPTLKGAEKTINKELAGMSVSGSGDKLGGNFGKGFKSGVGKIAIGNFMGNMLTQGVSMAADAAVQIVGDSFEQIARYEQLAGGAQKIFDEVDYSKILGDANKAYIELNMSANDYLEAINQTGASFAATMGDEKGYDTAREGMLAIADYASGTGRSLDELTEKYSLITRSTSSYQSIADQFSGILPATSADFLAQAQAAGLLADSYTSLTEVPVDEYQQAVTAMLTQGVADLGLAQNTMNESTNTLSGSIAMTQAAWTNFLTSLGSPDMDPSAALNDLMASLSTAMSLIGPIITEQLLPNLGVALGQAVAYIITHIPDIIAAAGQLILGFVSGLANGLVPAMDAINGVVQGCLDAAGEFVSGMFTAGADLIQGFIDGIKSLIDQVGTVITEGVGGAVGDLLGFLGIASPSKLFEQIGQYTMAGLANGISGGASIAANAMQNATSDVFSSVGSGFSTTATVNANYSGSAIADSVNSSIGNLGIYLDGNLLVGGIASRMDRALVVS